MFESSLLLLSLLLQKLIKSLLIFIWSFSSKTSFNSFKNWFLISLYISNKFCCRINFSYFNIKLLNYILSLYKRLILTVNNNKSNFFSIMRLKISCKSIMFIIVNYHLRLRTLVFFSLTTIQIFIALNFH